MKSDPAWRWAIGCVLAGRIALSLWTFAIVQLYPFLVTNLTLYGAPVVAAFDQRTGDRYAFSRSLDGRTLHLRATAGGLVDAETATVWNAAGDAVSGTLVGSRLGASSYSLEQIFPYVGTTPSSNLLLAVWQRFDTNWYLKIAARGYDATDGSTVYFPTYPILIRVVGTLLLGDYLLAALVISSLALVGALVVLYRIASDLVGPNAAKRALLLLLLFPTAFFLFSGYTESLFLFFSLASLRNGQKSHWLGAGIWGALAALTRLQGVLLIIPLAYAAWRDRDAFGPRVLFLILLPLATMVFFMWQYSLVGSGSLFGVYEGQLHARFVMPWENLAAAISLIAGARASLVDILNLAVTGLFGVLVLALFRQPWMPLEFTLYAALMFLAPLFRMTTEQPLVSMVRYVIVLFPVFIALGVWANNLWVQRAAVYSSMPLALYLCAQFVMWGWVG